MHLCMQPLKSVVKWKTKTSEIRAADVLKLCYQGQFNLIIRLENILKTSWRCLEYVFVRRLEYILKTPWRRFSKTSWKCLEDVLKTSKRRLEDVLQDVLTTSWRRMTKMNILVLIKTSSSRAVLQKRWSYKFRKIHKKASKKRLRHRFFLANSARFLIISFLKNSSDSCLCINTPSVYCRTTTFRLFKSNVIHIFGLSIFSA